MAEQQTAMLSKDALLKNAASRKTLCFLENLEGSVYIQEISGRKALIFQERIQEYEKEGATMTPSQQFGLMALLISMSVVNEDGTPMFTEPEALTLCDGSFPAFEELAEKCLEHSGLVRSAEAKENLKNALITSTTNLPTN